MMTNRFVLKIQVYDLIQNDVVEHAFILSWRKWKQNVVVEEEVVEGESRYLVLVWQRTDFPMCRKVMEQAKQ
jgi:hypothetical protein